MLRRQTWRVYKAWMPDDGLLCDMQPVIDYKHNEIQYNININIRWVVRRWQWIRWQLWLRCRTATCTCAVPSVAPCWPPPGSCLTPWCWWECWWCSRRWYPGTLLADMSVFVCPALLCVCSAISSVPMTATLISVSWVMTRARGRIIWK